jgi:hypothetical protein
MYLVKELFFDTELNKIIPAYSWAVKKFRGRRVETSLNLFFHTFSNLHFYCSTNVEEDTWRVKLFCI